MFEISDIYKVTYMTNRFAYVGLLRNEKRFNIGDNVFVAIADNRIIRTTIVGVELPPVENHDYIYKIRIPKEWVKENCPEWIDFNESEKYEFTLICDRIFSSIEEAKQSAIKNANRMHELELQQIEIYFKQFESSK